MYNSVEGFQGCQMVDGPILSGQASLRRTRSIRVSTLMERNENRIDELSAEIARDWNEILFGNLRHLRLSRELEAERRLLVEERSRLQQKLDGAKSLLLVRGGAEVAERFDRLTKDNGALEERILELSEKLAAADSRCDSLVETLDHRRTDLQHAEAQLLKLRRELASAALNSGRIENERSRLEHAVTSMMRLEFSESGPPRGTLAQQERRARSGGFARGVLVGLLIAVLAAAGLVFLWGDAGLAPSVSEGSAPPAMVNKGGGSGGATQ